MERIQKLRQILEQLNLDAVLITSPENRRYLSGFTGSSGGLLISKTEAYLVTDFRYWEQMADEAPQFMLYKQNGDLFENIAKLIRELTLKKVGFEEEQVTYGQFRKLSELLTGFELISIGDDIQRLRWAKEESEIGLITKAVDITDIAWEKTLALLKPGVREQDIALEFDYQLRLNGAEGNAFTTIVASGFRSALPHGAASEKKIQNGELVIIDGGALYQGYHGDLTRTVVVGKADDEQKRIYNIVLQAQLKALNCLRSGLVGKDVDAVARNFIASEGYGDKFGHGLGHSVGLEIHESPRLSLAETGIIPLHAAITVEPGIYIPNWGGVRIEDLVIVEENGIQNLTKSPKEKLLEV